VYKGYERCVANMRHVQPPSDS